MSGMLIMTVGLICYPAILSGLTLMTPGITTVGGIVPVGISHGDGMIHGGALPIGDGIAHCIGGGIAHVMEDGPMVVIITTSIRDGIRGIATWEVEEILPTTADTKWDVLLPEAG
jgi:hypothetical protein